MPVYRRVPWGWAMGGWGGHGSLLRVVVPGAPDGAGAPCAAAAGGRWVAQMPLGPSRRPAAPWRRPESDARP